MKSPPRGRKNSASSSQSSLQQRRRIGFRFFRSSDSSADKSLNEEGLAEDDLTLPSSTTSSTSSSSSSSLLANSYSSASTNTASAAAAAVAAGNNTRRQHGARAFLHGIKRNLMSINMAISISTGVTTATGGATTISGGGGDGGGGGGMSFGGVISRHLKNRRLMVVDHRLLKEQNQKRQRQQQERQLDSSSVVFETVDYSTKTTPMASSNTAAAATTRLDHEKDDVGLITADLMEDITAAANDVGLNVDKAMRVVTSAPPRGGDLSSMTTSSTDVGLSTETIAADTTSSTTTSSQQEATFIIETPLFPIILPKAWEAPFMGTSSYSKSATRTASSSSTTTTTTSSSSSYISSMEITVAPPEDITTTSSSSGGGTVKPTSHQLQQVTLPLIPKSQWTSFTGQEFFYPEPYNGLVDTGVCMASNTLSSEYVTWSGDKKTEKFIKDYMTNDDGGGEEKKKSWYDALDSSQEVLVWSGKFISSNNEEYYGSELPIIKTTSIIHKSPKYLAELLMDSTKVKAYNKMSLGRDDVHVFQSGVDTSREDGKLGVDGECKIVRNLTRPPMVNSNLEFVSEYISLSLFLSVCFEEYIVCVQTNSPLSPSSVFAFKPLVDIQPTYLILYSLHACTKVK